MLQLFIYNINIQDVSKGYKSIKKHYMGNEFLTTNLHPLNFLGEFQQP